MTVIELCVRTSKANILAVAAVLVILINCQLIQTIQSALVIRTTFVPLCFSEENALIASGSYECSYSQRNYLVFWKFVLTVDALISRFLYDVLISRVLIARADCTVKPEITHTVIIHSFLHPPVHMKHIEINLRKAIICDNP